MTNVNKTILIAVSGDDLQLQLLTDAAAIGATVQCVSVRRASRAATTSEVEICFDSEPDDTALDASIAQYVADNG